MSAVPGSEPKQTSALGPSHGGRLDLTVAHRRTAVAFTLFLEPVRARPVEADFEGNMVHGVGINGDRHLPC